MRKSKVLHKLRSGSFVRCFKVNIPDPRVSEIAALAGFDCVWVDQEHIGQDWSQLASSIWATKSRNTDIVVRVPRGSYSDYIRPLELDATGIMVPHIISVKDAEEVIQMTRFHPVGRRPLDGGNNDGAYTMMDFNHYIEQANKERFIILQIEDPEPLSDLDKIAALEGYDMLFFGPGDFSQGIGAVGQWDHPEISRARKLVAETARKHGKFAGTVGGPGNFDALRTMGYQFVSLGADVVGLAQYCQQILSDTGGSTPETSSKNYFETN